MIARPVCRRPQRRGEVRRSATLAGFDYLEVAPDQRSLRVHLLGRLPGQLTKDNLRIEGGRRVRNVAVVDVFVRRFAEPELDDYVDVVLDRFGDASTYTLRAVARSDEGSWAPHPEFDPVYDRLDFSFKAGCPTELDCPSPLACPPPERPRAAINYLAKDYASFRQLLLDRLAVVMPEWTNRFVPDLGVTLVELLAYAGDSLSYDQDAVATEAYLDTARQRISVRRHARLVDYALHEGCNARAFVVVGTTDTFVVEPGTVQFITPAAKNAPTELTVATLEQMAPGPFETFEPIARTVLHPGHETLAIYTWGDRECCLARGATAVTLTDAWVEAGGDTAPDRKDGYARKPPAAAKPRPPARRLQLRPGDFVLFEEVLGPKTGAAPDRDPDHRWVVRLTEVEADVDPLTGTPIVHVTWAREDALPFPLCLSAIGPAPECAPLTDVSVARGNVVLVDHGRTVDETLPPVPAADTTAPCACEGVAGEVVRRPRRFRPRLEVPGLAFREPLVPQASAAQVQVQDPHRAAPLVTLAGGRWIATPDLLGSHGTDRHVVVEIDNDRAAWLRFGDGTHGAPPPVGVAFAARYRVGGGVAGNVGAEGIAHALWPSTVSSVIVSVRNPLAARGGIEPQPLGEAKLFAPQAFRRRLERAVTAADYAAIAAREFPSEVQRAAAALRWNGSWHEALVAVDAFGTERASDDLVRRVYRRLLHYRRIGHDLRVEAATRVPVRIDLSVCVDATYLRAHVLADLQRVFGTGAGADGRPAFFHPDRLSFGEALYLSQVIAAAQWVPGVRSVRTVAFERLFDGPRGEIARGYLAFGPFEIAQCDSRPDEPEHGRIAFTIGGGR